MTRYRIELAPEAEADIGDAHTGYRERSATAAEAFKQQVLDAIDSLADTADRWPADEQGFRRRLLRRFPYTVHFQVDGDVVTVLAVAHQRHRPGYWRGR